MIRKLWGGGGGGGRERGERGGGLCPVDSETNRENSFLNLRVLPKKYGTTIHLKITF